MAESECRQSNENPSEPLPVPLPPDQLNATSMLINNELCINNSLKSVFMIKCTIISGSIFQKGKSMRMHVGRV